jgi:hypothetical protein
VGEPGKSLPGGSRTGGSELQNEIHMGFHYRLFFFGGRGNGLVCSFKSNWVRQFHNVSVSMVILMVKSIQFADTISNLLKRVLVNFYDS